MEAQATCVAGGTSTEATDAAAAPLATDASPSLASLGGKRNKAPATSEGAHRVSPALQVTNALPAFWRDTMFSTLAMKP